MNKKTVLLPYNRELDIKLSHKAVLKNLNMKILFVKSTNNPIYSK